MAKTIYILNPGEVISRDAPYHYVVEKCLANGKQYMVEISYQIMAWLTEMNDDRVTTFTSRYTKVPISIIVNGKGVAACRYDAEYSGYLFDDEYFQKCIIPEDVYMIMMMRFPS